MDGGHRADGGHGADGGLRIKKMARNGSKREKWSNFAKNGQKLPITQNEKDGFFSSGHIRN